MWTANVVIYLNHTSYGAQLYIFLKRPGVGSTRFNTIQNFRVGEGSFFFFSFDSKHYMLTYIKARALI